MTLKNGYGNKIEVKGFQVVNSNISLKLPRFLVAIGEIKEGEVILSGDGVYSEFRPGINGYDLVGEPEYVGNARFIDKETMVARKDIHPGEYIKLAGDKRVKPKLFRAPNMFVYNLMQFVFSIALIVISYFVVLLIKKYF